MNKTLLLIIIDFLFLNLIALTRWEKVEPARAQQPPIPAVAANAATQDEDLVGAMRQALADEQATREEALAQVQAERSRLSASLSQTQAQAARMERDIAAAREESSLAKGELARLQRDLADKGEESGRQRRQIADLEGDRERVLRQIQGLATALAVGEAEKRQLQAEAARLQAQVQAERADRMKVQESAATLAQGMGQLAEKSGELTREIRENRPINANVLYSEFIANRVTATFTASRQGMFRPLTRAKETPTVLATDGKRVCALLHIADTVFSLWDPNYDWDRVGVGFSRPPAYATQAASLSFLSPDPRVVIVPVDPSQAAAIGAKVYPLAADPFRFPDAVLISAKGYGEMGFKLDPGEPAYVRLDNRLFKRLFGDFSPSRGDLVLSHAGELLGIMVNSDYCALVRDFTPLQTILTGEDTSGQHTGRLLDGMAARIREMPLKLQ